MERVNVIYHYKGRWIHIPKLAYIEGDSKLLENVDIDYLSFTHILKAYKEEFGVSGVKKLCYVKPGAALASGQLNVIENDDEIKKLTKLIRLSFHPTDTLRIYPLSNGDSTTLVGTGSDYDQLMNDIINELVAEEHIQSNDERERVMETNDGETGGQHKQPIDKGKRVMQTDDGETFVEDNVDLDSEEDEFDINSEAVTIQLINQSKRNVKYDIDDNNPHFILGMSFKNAVEARLAIRTYSVAKCTPLKIKPNDSERLRAKCKTQGCPFHLYISKDGNTRATIVRRIEGEHNCLRDGNNSLVSAKFLKDKIYTNPKKSVKEIIADAEKRMKLYVSKSKGKRAKRIVMHELDGSFKAEFANIGAYAAKIKEENPGTTVELEICEESLRNEGKFVFKRIFFCFDTLKRGWRAGCRPIIGLDGAHLKGIVSGQVLVAVGQDGNDQLYPVAWAVIGTENKDNWDWFLQLLIKELQIEDGGRSLTIVSDMQKDLVHAVSEILPHVEHRYYARHMYSNWSKKWRGEELKKRFWCCAWSSFKEEFDDNLKMLGDISKKAAEDFVAYNPGTFCRAFFSFRSKSHMVDNNITESFNSSIVDARHKPIVSMLDEMRLSAMMK